MKKNLNLTNGMRISAIYIVLYLVKLIMELEISSMKAVTAVK